VAAFPAENVFFSASPFLPPEDEQSGNISRDRSLLFFDSPPLELDFPASVEKNTSPYGVLPISEPGGQFPRLLPDPSGAALPVRKLSPFSLPGRRWLTTPPPFSLLGDDRRQGN